MKLLLPYLVEFSKNGIIVSKKYPSDYIMRGGEKRLLRLTIYNESTFSTNDR